MADWYNVRMHRDLWDPAGVTGGLALRSWSGQVISVDWGEPNAEGFHEPTFTLSGDTEAQRLDAAMLKIREALPKEWCDCPPYPHLGIGKYKHLPSCRYGIVEDFFDIAGLVTP